MIKRRFYHDDNTFDDGFKHAADRFPDPACDPDRDPHLEYQDRSAGNGAGNRAPW